MKTTFLNSLLLCILLFPLSPRLAAQDTKFPAATEDLQALILELDRQFWMAYNSCDVDKMASFLTEDLEFYHDKGGLTETSATLIEGIRRGLCNPADPRLRREAIEGTVEVFPMADYGAIISGHHQFHVTMPGQQHEVLDGAARFTHLWRFADGEWRMARVLSYDHKPVHQE